MRRECRNVFPRRRFQRKPLVSDPGMHHGTCVTHVPWCMSGSLTWGDGENVPGIPGACAPAILGIWQEANCIDIQTCLPITGSLRSLTVNILPRIYLYATPLSNPASIRGKQPAAWPSCKYRSFNELGTRFALFSVLLHFALGNFIDDSVTALVPSQFRRHPGGLLPDP